MRIKRDFSLAETWGGKVVARREELGITQAQLAELCGVKQQTISKIERGEIVPLDSLKQTIAASLGTSPWLLFEWPGQPRMKARAS